ncbi:MAG: YraN family protein [Micrococcales bacterium]|nr:YraN family protein [Micrococcales bacterium]
MSNREHKRQQSLLPRPTSLPPDTDRVGVGAYGEYLAAQYLRSAHYLIVERNWRCRFGEIDLVAQLGQMTVICEVRTRRGHRAGSGLESVTRRKLRRLHRLANQWQVERDSIDCPIRIDVIGIQLHIDESHTIHHVRGAG